MINELKEIYEAKNLLIQSCRTEEQLLKLNHFITNIERNLEFYGLVESVELFFTINERKLRNFSSKMNFILV